ncbi:ADP-ribosylglycohydrolase family protein [Tsukamurella paurometabola]
MWGRREQQGFPQQGARDARAAVGDVLGAPVDGMAIDAIRGRTARRASPPTRPRPRRRGAVTHHTQLTLFSVDGGRTPRRHRRLASADRPAPGVPWRWATTQRGLGPGRSGARTTAGWREGVGRTLDPARAPLWASATRPLGMLEAPKNPARRARPPQAPFGLLVGWEPQLVAQLAVECAAQTHGHPVGYLAAGGYRLSSCTRWPGGQPGRGRAARARPLRRGRDTSRSATRSHRRWAPYCRHAAGTVTELVGSAGAEGLLAAVYCALVGEDVRHGLCLAVNRRRAQRRRRRADRPAARCAARRDGPAAGLAGRAGGPSHDPGTRRPLSAMEMTQGPALHGPTGASPAWLTRYPRGAGRAFRGAGNRAKRGSGGTPPGGRDGKGRRGRRTNTECPCLPSPSGRRGRRASVGAGTGTAAAESSSPDHRC